MQNEKTYRESLESSLDSSRSWQSHQDQRPAMMCIDLEGELSLLVLEAVGKKTMQVINETDPGLNQTKTLLVEGKEKANLSQMLRDAKKAREEKEKEEIIEMQKAAFDYWFEEKQVRTKCRDASFLSSRCQYQRNFTSVPFC